MANNQTLCFFLCISLSNFIFLAASGVAAFAPNPSSHPISYPLSQYFSFDYIFQFGDSVSDVGNLRGYPVGPNNTCGGYPYGVTLNKSTGRCSDGLLIIDYLAEFFHLTSPGAYLAREDNFSNGVNFAVAGATAISADVLRSRGIYPPVTNASLHTEIKRFKHYLNSTCGNIYGPECQKVVSNSLIMMGEIGGNDVNFALYYQKKVRKLHGMLAEIVRTITKAVEEVIKLGATRIVVPGNFPIGCLPVFLTLYESKDQTKYDEWKCLKYLNNFVKLQNDYLQQAINQLQQQYPNVAIVYGDNFSAFKWLLQNAASLGFNESEALKACCGFEDGKYNFDASKRCGMEGVPVCPNPNVRLNFDGIHLTQHAHFHITQWLLRSIVPGLFKIS